MGERIDPNLLLELLKDEYTMLQGFYEDIDNRCITIKGWSITVGMATVSAGFIYSDYLFLAAVFAAILFWYLEGYWRGLSFYFARRILEIERGIREKDWQNLVPMQVYHSWERSFERYGKQTRSYMFKEISLMPHLFIALVSLSIAILRLSGLW